VLGYLDAARQSCCLGSYSGSFRPGTEIAEIGSVLIRSEQHTEGRKRCARRISMWKVGEEYIRSD
jgi:hypothetical protein